jgi:hypothetical protein
MWSPIRHDHLAVTLKLWNFETEPNTGWSNQSITKKPEQPTPAPRLILIFAPMNATIAGPNSRWPQGASSRPPLDCIAPFAQRSQDALVAQALNLLPDFWPNVPIFGVTSFEFALKVV